MGKYWNDGAFKENFKGSFEDWYTEYKNGCELKLDDWGADEDLLFLLGQKDEERNALAKYYFANFGGNLDYLLNPFRKIPNCEGCEGVTLEKCIEYLFLKDIHNNKEGQADLKSRGQFMVSIYKNICNLLIAMSDENPRNALELIRKTEILQEIVRYEELLKQYSEYQVLISRVVSFLKEESAGTEDMGNLVF